MVRPVVVYTLMRLALFLGSLGLASAVFRIKGLAGIVVALLLSAVLSALLLKRQRDAIAEAAAGRAAARSAEKERLQARLRDES